MLSVPEKAENIPISIINQNKFKGVDRISIGGGAVA